MQVVSADTRVREQNIAVWMAADEQNLLHLGVIVTVRREIATVDDEDVLENRAVLQYSEHGDRLLPHLLLLLHRWFLLSSLSKRGRERERAQSNTLANLLLVTATCIIIYCYFKKGIFKTN